MRTFVLMAVCAIVWLVVPRAAIAQDGAAVRFEITSVGDSTFSFAIGHHSWVKRGEHGIAVDPVHRDALVARFTVIGVDEAHGSATALITGQATEIGTQHVALLLRPSPPWYRQHTFWLGTIVGAVLGGVVAIVR